MKKWKQLPREVKSNLEWLSLKYPTLCFVWTLPHLSRLRFFSFVVSPMPPLPSHKSWFSPWGHLLSHLCSQSLLLFSQISIPHYTVQQLFVWPSNKLRPPLIVYPRYLSSASYELNFWVSFIKSFSRWPFRVCYVLETMRDTPCCKTQVLSSAGSIGQVGR